MLLPTFVLAFGAGLFLLVYWLGRRASAHRLWSSAILTGLALGALRALAVCTGWWAVERTSGWLQIPGYVLAIFGWPEATLVPRTHHLMTGEGYALLAAMLFTGTIALVLVAAACVAIVRSVRSRAQ